MPNATEPNTGARLSASDILEIHELYARYSYAVDTGNGAMRGSVFTDDGTLATYLSDHKPEHVSLLVERTDKKGNHGHRHFMSNIMVEGEGDQARGTCLALVLGRQKADATDTYDPVPGNGFTFKTGFFKDAIVRTPKGWRFKSRELFLDFETDTPFSPRHP